jgi:hypothetical protein
MADEKRTDTSPEGGADKRADVSDMPNRDQRPTKAGQEANQNAPAEHDHEHHSTYGGGGPNGGTKA